MSIPQMRKFLKVLTPDEWSDVLECSHSFAALVRGGAKMDGVDAAAVRQWVLLPRRSDKLLEFAVMGTAGELLPDGWDLAQGLPAELEDVRTWVEGVASSHGSGPAKVCLLAAKESSAAPMSARDLDGLRRLIVSTPRRLAEPAPAVEDEPDAGEGSAVAAEGAEEPTDADDPPEEFEPDMAPANPTGRGETRGADADLDDLDVRLANLTRLAAAAATLMREEAAGVELGRALGDTLGPVLEEYGSHRAVVLGDVGALADGLALSDLASSRTAVAAERDRREQGRQAAEQESRERSERAATLLANVEQLDLLLATADPAVAPGLTVARESALSELRTLGMVPETAPGPADEQHASTSPGDVTVEVAEGAGADTEPSVAVTAGAPAESGTVDGCSAITPIEQHGDRGSAPAGHEEQAHTQRGQAPPDQGTEALSAPRADRAARPEPTENDPQRDPDVDPGAERVGSADARPERERPSGEPEPVRPADGTGAGLDTTPVAALVAASQPLAAALLVRASRSEQLLADALLFNGAAFASGPDGISPTEAVHAGAELDADALVDDRAAAVATITAAARTALAAGWAPGHLLDGLLGSVHLESEWHEFLSHVAKLTHQGYVHRPTAAPDRATPVREEFADRARASLHELESATTKYHRATRVLHYLARNDQPLGAALAALAAWSEGDDAAIHDVRRLSSELRNARSRQRIVNLADEHVSTPQQRRNDIVAGAANQLNARIDEVASLLTAGLDANLRPHAGAADEGTRHQLVAQARALPQAVAASLESALLEALRRWVVEPSVDWPEKGVTLEDLQRAASLPLTFVPRGPDQQPDLGAVAWSDVASALLDPPTAEALVESYAESGNLAAAAEAAGSRPGLGERLVDQRSNWRARLSGMVREAESGLARARADSAVADEDVSRLEGALASLAAYDGERFDLQVEKVHAVLTTVAGRLEEEAGRLRARLADLTGPAADATARVSALIDAGDLATAREYLFQLESGAGITEPQDDTERHLEVFAAAVADLPSDARADQVYEELRDGDEDELAREGLQSWASLVLNPLRSSKMHLPGLLGLIGLDTDLSRVTDVSSAGIRNAKVFRVKAQPRDGSVVPGLGSRAAGQYHVTVLSPQRLDPEQALSLVPEARRDEANLILVPQVLTEHERRHFLRASRRLAVRALVVDAACVGYVAAVAPGSFRTLQQITLPYATYTHYTPFVAGDVPEEVFVGRSDEARQIIDPAGSLFVYGGRQLGKSALLRHISRTVSDGGGRKAVYVDLKAKMIGEAHDPAHLWQVLLEEFQREGIIGPRVASGTAKVVVEQTQKWLREDETRRLLLLLDEADLFLESEARERREGNRSVRFPNVSPLKDLMESTNRRFKPVFAGLHQVQRFHEISNTPLAHGGRDILVGPLDRRAALDLVEKPFSALGYRFESRDLVSRLLAFTNYQASLVQIVCDHLATRMAGRDPAPGQPPVTITSADVDLVTQDREVRQQLAERFRLTIRLEDRYAVIALVVAMLSFEDAFTSAYDASEVYDWCRGYWPVGFGDMTAREFGLYLEEMAGLGVLVRRADGRVSVRSPNVVSMLGSRADLEQQLDEGGFELPHDYNPRAARRTVRTSRGELRSPLTEQDLQIVVPQSGGSAGLHLVVGSRALGVQDVPEVLEAVARERERRTVRVAGDDFAGWVTSSGAGPRRERDVLPVVDGTQLPPGPLEQLLELAHRTVARRAGQSVVVVAGPRAEGLIAAWLARLASVTVLERWNDEALRSISDSVLVDPRSRAEVLAVTSGWPELVDEVLRRVAAGASLDTVVEDVGSIPRTSAAATAFLESVGVDTVPDALRRWVNLASPGEAVNPADLQRLFEDVSDGVFIELADRLAALHVVTGAPSALVLDPVVHRAVRHLADDGR
ncbi:AAA family ATPase [Fodinibacter luteus]|uniref:AAA family ATPase n=1 Tax=Fodinibacter luteus TaxID=552064 RepID=UPI0031ECD5E1